MEKFYQNKLIKKLFLNKLIKKPKKSILFFPILNGTDSNRLTF